MHKICTKILSVFRDSFVRCARKNPSSSLISFAQNFQQLPNQAGKPCVKLDHGARPNIQLLAERPAANPELGLAPREALRTARHSRLRPVEKRPSFSWAALTRNASPIAVGALRHIKFAWKMNNILKLLLTPVILSYFRAISLAISSYLSNLSIVGCC